jgi:hypothetical protein
MFLKILFSRALVALIFHKISKYFLWMELLYVLGRTCHLFLLKKYGLKVYQMYTL